MKSFIRRPNRSQRGSVLLVILATVAVLGIVLASVLRLVVQENRILTRTATWNAALPFAEAGVEEAMSHLHQVDGGFRGVNGWDPYGSSFRLVRTNLGSGRFVAGITSETPPTIISVGQVWCPSANRYIERRVRVGTLGRGLFNKGLVAKNNISLGGTFGSDSFDSLKPELSTNGQYDPAKRSDNGDIGSNLSVPGAINLSGTVKIYGKVATGPLGTVTINNNASVGTTNWINGGNLGIQPGRYEADMNVSFPNATVPHTNTSLPYSGVVNGTNYDYILDYGDYTLPTLDLRNKQMLVRGHARLVVNNDVDLSGQATVQIHTNASLEIYVKSGSATFTGQSVVNASGRAANFSLIGLPGVTDIKLSGNGKVVGTMYAPHASLKLSGNGSDELDFMGAAIVNDVSGIGHFKFHYDESLGYNSTKKFVINSWKEF